MPAPPSCSNRSPGNGAVRQLAGLVHAQVTDRLKTQKRADQLKDQVEQLRAIEKDLIERGGPDAAAAETMNRPPRNRSRNRRQHRG